MNRLVRLALLAGFLSATLALGKVAETQSKAGPHRPVSGLPAIPFLETLALAYREAVADLCWMQAVQYYGEYRQGHNDLAHFRHYIEAVNTLDPSFEHAHWFGAIVLASDAGDLEGGLEVLRRGVRDNPHSQTLPFKMGFLSYAVGRDLQRATQYFSYASTFPKGRERALRFRAFVNSKRGDLEKSYALWNDLFRTTTDENMKRVAQSNLAAIEEEIRQRRESSKPVTESDHHSGT